MGFRLLALFGFFTVILTAIGALIGGLWGLRGSVFLGFAFFLVSLAVNSLSYWYSPKIILGKYKAKPSEDRDLNGMVERLAINAKIPKPGVYVLPIDVPNSFAAGKSKDDASVCVTEGLLSMNKGEIESVISHEIYHIVNNDILIQDVTAVIADILRSTIVLIPLAVFLVKLAISESREYRADYYGSRISGKPKDLASALSKMNEITRQNPMGSSPAFECLWAVNPFRREGLEGMFSTHPPAARRVKRVEEMEHEGIPEPPEATEVD
jgi:heat shock protein HtpX